MNAKQWFDSLSKLKMKTQYKNKQQQKMNHIWLFIHKINNERIITIRKTVLACDDPPHTAGDIQCKVWGDANEWQNATEILQFEYKIFTNS